MTCASTPPTGSSTLPGGIVAVTERLGEQTIEGAIFCGSKRTTTYPAGSVFHNDRPVKAVDETWNAWEDGLPFFLVKNRMPAGETSTTWIRDVSLLEPDSTLFRPPAEYAVVEETGTFSIQLSRAIPAATSVHQVTALTDMPFSAEEAYEIRRTDPNGALLTQRFSLFHYRDGMGRTVFGSMIADSSGTQTFRPSLLMDMVAGYSYSFNHDAATVRRRPLRANFKSASQAVPPKPAGPEGWLGTQTIDGFQTFGRRMTQKYAPGTMGGNDRPFVVVEESWTSPQLGIALLTKRSHPEMGDTTATVRNVTVGEPDAALFRVPDGYRIIDESEKAHE